MVACVVVVCRVCGFGCMVHLVIVFLEFSVCGLSAVLFGLLMWTLVWAYSGGVGGFGFLVSSFSFGFVCGGLCYCLRLVYLVDSMVGLLVGVFIA